ncbi:MAG: SDR family oxidoreductase [Alphaproteobacteria bacterium]|nr:SDR family oxidoreductase [Alphaproteobacteria bacterium]MCB9691699.1 SDR family oxidoreductase [Alphaproteobacteria bacterium]
MTDLTQAPLLVTGASGTLGRVVVAELLATTSGPLVLPLRAHHDPADVARAIADERTGLTPGNVRARCTFVPLGDDVLGLLQVCREAGVRGILHVAGCVAYFDRPALAAGNEGLTAGFLALGQALGVDGFVFVSTAFSSGYRDGLVPEALHATPESDPTAYTASKRAAEHLVASSGLPFTLARPSVVIGDSVTGRYSGRPYGIYQLWRGFERLLADRWQPTFHAVASDRPLQLVHQDDVAAGLVASLRQFRPGAVVHLVSDPQRLPTARQAWELWLDEVVQPETRVFHGSLQEADRSRLGSRQRLFLDFTTTNLEIAEHPWTFETSGLEALRALGHRDRPVTLDTLRTCQRAFVATSPRLLAYLDHAGTAGRRAS